MSNSKFKIQNSKLFIAVFLFIFLVTFQLSPILIPIASAQTATPNADITSPGFRLVVCDGPENLRYINPDTGKYEKDIDPITGEPAPGKGYNNPKFVPCDFKGIMMTVNHLLTIAVMLGTVLALCLMLYAGFLYISGEPGKITEAHKIFPGIIKGFIIMLAAWFIVYQILAWLTNGNTFGVLLGTP